jgi:hypothetical protein
LQILVFGGGVPKLIVEDGSTPKGPYPFSILHRLGIGSIIAQQQ